MPHIPAHDESAGGEGSADPRQIATTHWSLVVAAGRRNSPQSAAALEALCRAYWQPLYAYVRRRVPDLHEAQDMTQEFFARLIEKDFLAQASAERGRFRSFLLTALKHFLANEWDKAQTQKRGGNRKILSIDLAAGESRYALEPVSALTPERAFDRQWAMTVIDDVMERLRDELAQSGKAGQFELLHEFLAGRPAPGAYDRAAIALGISVGAAQVAAHRMRLRYRELLRAEIAKTVADPADVDDEIRELVAALGS
jgi:RNA polymerase sigma-70 factor (ECF subfamily)